MNMMMVGDSFYIPKVNPARPRGEDAHFFCRKSQVIGVADGVSSWSKVGVDAGVYAREFMTNAAKSVKNSLPAAVDPKSVLAYASAKTVAPGSATATIISLAGNRLRAANVGDSGFAVIRGGQTIYLSPVQLHGFNSPRQLHLGSPAAAEAEEMAVEVMIGDVVVVGTDGLFDNVFPGEVAETVDRCFGIGMSPGMVAHELAVTALRKSKERTTVSPFSEASERAGIPRLGGKRDDITVVCVKIVPSNVEITKTENRKPNRKIRKFGFGGIFFKCLIADLFDD